jgi:hypothetical protein
MSENAAGYLARQAELVGAAIEPTGRLILRTDVPPWLETHYGPVAKTTTKTLAKFHWAGSGPRAVKWGQRVAYYESELHEWVRRRLRLVNSSSDRGCAPPLGPGAAS